MPKNVNQKEVHALCQERRPGDLYWMLGKTMEELGEVAETVVKPQKRKHLPSELADVYICLLTIAEEVGADLEAETLKKLNKLEAEVRG